MKREAKALRLPRTVLVAILAASSTAYAQTKQSGSDAAPPTVISRLIVDALRMKAVETSVESPPALSPDGKLLAYAVRTFVTDRRARRSIPPGATEREAFLLRRPLELLMLEIATGKVTRLSPPLASGWQPVWSADGSYLVFYSDADGGIRLWVYQRSSGRSRRVSDAHIAEGFRATTPAQWSRNGKKEVYVALNPPDPPRPELGQVTVTVHRSGREVESLGDAAPRRIDPGFDRSLPGNLAVIDLHSGAARIVVPANADPPPQRPYPSPSGRWLLYGAPPRNNIWLSGGKTPPDSLADLSTDLALVPSGSGAPILLAEDVDVYGTAWHPRQDMVAYVKAGKLWVAACDQHSVPVRRHLAPELGRLRGTFLAFAPDGRSLLTGVSGAAGETALAVAPLDGTPAKLIAAGSGLSFVDLVMDASRTLWQPDGRSATALLSDTRTGEELVWRVDLTTGVGTELWRGRGKFRFTGVSTEPPGMFAVTEDPRNPPDLFWFSRDLTEKRRLTHLNPQLEEAPIGPIEYFMTEVPAFDGTLSKVRTAVMRPLGAARDGSARGLVCVYPGADYSASVSLFGGGEMCGIPSYILAATGFTVVLPHLPKRPRDTKGNVSQEYADALLPVVYRAAALGHVDAGRVALFGHSQGAYAASAILSETNLFRAAVCVSSAAYDLIASWGYVRPGFIMPNIWPITGHLMNGPPWEDLKRYVENSPYLQADKIASPVLLVVGTSDRFPHVEEAGKFFNALRTYEKTVQLAIYEGEDHRLFRGSLANSVDLWQRILDFLDRHVAPPDSGGPSKGAR